MTVRVFLEEITVDFAKEIESIACIVNNPGPRDFLLPRRDQTKEKKKRGEKTSGSGRCEEITVDIPKEMRIYDRCESRESIKKQPITTHLSVNKNQSDLRHEVSPIRRQGSDLEPSSNLFAR